MKFTNQKKVIKFIIIEIMKIKKSDKIFLKYHNPFKYCLNESSGSRTPCFFIWPHISSASS